MPDGLFYFLYVTTQFFLWFMVGRIILALLSGGRRTFFTDLFRVATFPVFWLVRRVTPASVSDSHIPLLSLPLLFALLILIGPPPR